MGFSNVLQDFLISHVIVFYVGSYYKPTDLTFEYHTIVFPECYPSLTL